MLASMTGLGRGIPAVNLDKGSSVPFGFVFQLADKLAPSYITDGLCLRVVLDHILDRQALNANDLVFMDNACRELVLIISSSVVDMGMDFGNFQTSLVPVLGALLFPGMPTLGLCKLLLIRGRVVGVANGLTSREGNHGFDPKIKPNHLWSDGKRLHVFFYQDRDEVAMCTIFRDRDRTGLAAFGQRSMPDNIQRLIHLSQRERLPIPFEGIGSIGSRLLVAFFLERGVLSTAFKEIDKRPIQMPQSLLYGNGRDKSKPWILFLERGEHGSKIVVVEALSMLKIGYFTVRETPVVDKADTSERLSKHAFLLIGRIEPEFVGPLGLLAHELLALSLFLDVQSQGSQNFAIERAIILFGDRSYLFQQGSRESNGQRLYLIFHIAILTLIWLHVKGIAPHPKPQTRNGPYIPIAEARGFTGRIDKNYRTRRARSTANCH